MAMDPVSAIGLAANILQFIEYSCRIISDAKEIYQSTHGATAENIELQGVAENLSSLSASMIQPAKSTPEPISQAEQKIYELASSSKALADELLATIQGLQISGSRHRKWRSFRQALNTVWKKDKIGDLQKRLEMIRRHLSIHILSHTR